LAVPRPKAEEVLDRQTESGRAIQSDAERLETEPDYGEWNNRLKRWKDLTSRALTTVFTTPEAANDFGHAASPGVVFVGPSSVQEDLKQDLRALDRAINTLVSLKEQLDFIEGPVLETPAQPRQHASVTDSRNAKVFIVHGRDIALKTRVARTLEQTGEHAVVILHEQANQGRTIIEKFEDHASATDFAVIIASGDDLGRLHPKHVGEHEPTPEDQPRPRQNVIFELGYFVAKLGRSRVAVLYEPGVQLPSDYAGVTYTGVDPGGRWEYDLLRELRAANLSFDTNKLT